MAGLTIEQLKKMGAMPKQTGNASFGERVSVDLAKRREALGIGIEAQSRGQQTRAETVLQATGQGAGLVFDVAGEALKSVIDKIPDAIKVPIKQLGRGILHTPLGQSGIKAISGGIDNYREWKMGNPRAARDLEAVINIAMLLPAGRIIGVAGKKAISATGEIAGKGATKIEAGLAKQTFDEALDIIKPVLSKTEKQQALEAGRGIVSRKILPRKFEKITLIPTVREQEMAKTIIGVVNKSKNPIDNINAIQNEITKVAQSVQEGLKANNTIFNKAQLKTVLNKAKDESQIVFGSDKTLQSSYDAIVNEMMRQAEKTTGNLSGLLRARKNFDKIIEQKFPKLLSNPIGDMAKQNAVRDVRRSVNQFISDQLPAGNIFKEELRKQNLMYDAIKNISQKTASAVDASTVQMAIRALRQNPLVAGVTGGILTYAALMGLFSNPVVIGTLVLGGTYKLGKMIITARILRESLVSVLRALEKAGKVVDAKSIRNVIDILSKQ